MALIYSFIRILSINISTDVLFNEYKNVLFLAPKNFNQTDWFCGRNVTLATLRRRRNVLEITHFPPQHL